jgi:hypothetical protein
MSTPSPSPRLRPEDLPQAAVLVANMIEAFLDAQETPEEDANHINGDHERKHVTDRKEARHDSIESHTATSRPEGVCLCTSIDASALFQLRIRVV